MYVRLTKTVSERGVLVRPEQVEALITDRNTDWYVSAFTYGEDAFDYWEANGESIKGFNGKAWTSTIFFDIDAENKFELARINTVKLVNKLVELGLEQGIEIYFSGSKGFHVLVKTTNEITPTELAVMCQNLAIKEAKIDQTVFDSVVYNVTRIFRVANTKHQKSGLFKIPIEFSELEGFDEDQMRELAAQPRFVEFETNPVDVTELKDKYTKLKDNVLSLAKAAQTAQETENTPILEGSDLARLVPPPGERKCIYALEQGFYGPGERHNAVIRLAAAYRGRGYSEEHAKELISESLKRRAERYVDAKSPDQAETLRDILQIYSKEWKGGTFTCKTDNYLMSKCDHGSGPCYDRAESRLKGVLNIDQMFNEYLVYGDQALHEYPQFGIQWLDDKVRLRPQNYSVICGANGSGKTSLLICAMENFNRQCIPHIVFSLDMALPSLMEKIGARYTKFSAKEIEKAVNAHTRDPEMLKVLKKVLKEHFPYTYFDFTSSYSLEDIEARIQTMKEMGIDLQIAIVDYAGRLIAPESVGGGQSSQYAASTANALLANDVAKRAKIHMMFVAQISRENGDHTEPLRSSRVAKESGAWEENATAVITCWRPFGKGLDGNDKYFHIYIAKNRSGALGEHAFKWEGKTGSIGDLSEREFDSYAKLCSSKNVDLFVDNMIDSSQEITVDDLEKDSRFNSHGHGLQFDNDIKPQYIEQDEPAAVYDYDGPNPTEKETTNASQDRKGVQRAKVGGRSFKRA